MESAPGHQAGLRVLRTHVSARRIATLVACGVLLGACGSSPTTPSAASKISSNWVTFFNGATPAATKISLLQNGSEFAQIIDAQSSMPLAKSVTAAVSRVSDITASTASVRYDLLLGGTSALSNQLGRSVLQSGSWKVSDASFCVLLALEQVTVPACAAS